jgi:hypothetical protein
MSRAVNSVNDIEVIVNNVEQIPSGYSVSGTTLTFSVAPSSGTSNVYVRYLSTTNLSLAIPSGTSATFNTVTVADGSATTPSITNDGDTNTGIFFPAADTIGFSEGGAEAARFDASGNLCVGSTAAGNPATKSVSVGLAGTTTGGIQLWSPTTSAHSVQWGDGTSSTDPYRGYIEYDHASDSMRFATSSTERARIDSSGNVGIGTSSPATKLEVFNSAVNATFAPNTLSTWRVAQIRNDGTVNSNSAAGIAFVGRTDVQPAGIVGIQSTTGGGSASLAFLTVSGNVTSESARIDTSGSLLVGQTTPNGAEALGVTKNVSGTEAVRFYASHASDPYGLLIFYPNANPNGTANEFLGCYSSGSTRRMTVRSNGGIANFSANDVNLSDRREKTNFAPAKSYLDVICAIPVQTFNYIDQNLEEDAGLTLGVVAQDVQAVAPEMVMESNWATEEAPKMRLSIYQTDLQYALMKCIQEQQALITALTTRITALENNNATQ